jgi:FkbM family methyltransferase
MFHSQFGEDKILASVFAGKTNGCCVEVGANDGVTGSTTLYFEQLGWTTVLVEPNPGLCVKLRNTRTGKLFECAVSDAEGTITLNIAEGVPGADALSTISTDRAAQRTIERHGYATRPVDVSMRRLDNILAEAKLGQIDFMTVDVEGHELPALKGLGLDRWCPTILIVEDNSLFGEQKVKRYLKEQGYIRFYRTGVNDWFRRNGERDPDTTALSAVYRQSVIKGRLFAIRHTLAQMVKRIDGAEKLYRQTTQFWRGKNAR